MRGDLVHPIAQKHYRLDLISILAIPAFCLVSALTSFQKGQPLSLTGPKTVAVFDLWTLQHFFAGVILGALYYLYVCGPIERTLFLRSSIAMKAQGIALTGAYVWEIAEWCGETGLLGTHIAFWLHGLEGWPNRLIIDPLTLYVGVFIGTFFPRLLRWAVAFTIVWVAANLIAPSCQTIPALLFGF